MTQTPLGAQVSICVSRRERRDSNPPLFKTDGTSASRWHLSQAWQVRLMSSSHQGPHLPCRKRTPDERSCNCLPVSRPRTTPPHDALNLHHKRTTADWPLRTSGGWRNLAAHSDYPPTRFFSAWACAAPVCHQPIAHIVIVIPTGIADRGQDSTNRCACPRVPTSCNVLLWEDNR